MTKLNIGLNDLNQDTKPLNVLIMKDTFQHCAINI